jgi:hypothetical protein
MVRSEGDMSLKNPVTPPGIDPGTVRLAAQRLNHYATEFLNNALKCTHWIQQIYVTGVIKLQCTPMKTYKIPFL